MIGPEKPIELDDGELPTDPKAYQDYIKLQQEMEVWEEHKALDPYWNNPEE